MTATQLPQSPNVVINNGNPQHPPAAGQMMSESACDDSGVLVIISDDEVSINTTFVTCPLDVTLSETREFTFCKKTNPVTVKINRC